jgi:hypothetical protein
MSSFDKPYKTDTSSHHSMPVEAKSKYTSASVTETERLVDSDLPPLPPYDKSPVTRRLCIAGLIFSWIAGLVCTGIGVFGVLKGGGSADFIFGPMSSTAKFNCQDHCPSCTQHACFLLHRLPGLRPFNVAAVDVDLGGASCLQL